MKIINIRTCNKVSGAEKYNLYLLKEITSKKKVDVLTLTDNSQFLKELQDAKLNTKLIPAFKEIGTKRDLLRYIYYLFTHINQIRLLIKQIEHFSPNVVILQSMNEKLLLTLLLRNMSYKIIWIEHGPLFKTKRAWIIKRIYKVVGKYVNTIISVSHDTKEDLMSGGLKESKLAEAYIGIDTKYFVPFTNNKIQKGKRDFNIVGTTVIGFIGTVGNEKGIDRFLFLAKKLLARDNDFFFIIVGDGPLLKEAKRKVQKSNSSKFLFTGQIENVRDYLGIMDFLVFPTRHYEGISLSILESMSMKVCVLTTDLGGNKEIITNGENGLILSNFSYDTAVDMILSLRKELERFNKIRNRARETIVHKFNIVNNSMMIYKLLKS